MSVRPISVLVIGGAGAVGRPLVEHLHRHAPGIEIVVAGRDGAKADAFAAAWDERVRGKSLDAGDEGGLDAAIAAAGLVATTTETEAEAVARACARHGVAMVSVAASVSVMRAIDGLRELAERGGSALVTEVGLAPGLTNLMARRLAERFPGARSATLVLELGLLGRHGPEAIAWTLARAAEARRAEALDGFDGQGRTFVIPVPFVDGAETARALDLDHVASYLALRPRQVTRWLPRLARRFGTRSVVVTGAASLGTWAAEATGLPTDEVCLQVRLERGTETRTALLEGTDQSRITGAVAAETAMAVLREIPPGGVHSMDRVVDPADLREPLAAIGCRWSGLGDARSNSSAGMVSRTG